MTAIISRCVVERLSKNRPAFADEVAARKLGLSKSGHFVLEQEVWERLLDEYGARDALKSDESEPMHAEAVAVHLTGAIAGWAKAGFPVAPNEAYEERLRICSSCAHWNQRAWLGMGGCRICRCSRLKLMLATESCPDKPPRWHALEARI